MGWLDKWLLGTDLDAEAKRTEDLRAWESRLDAQARMQSVWTPEDWLAHQTQLESEQGGDLAPGTYDRQIYAAGGEGAREGLATMAAGTRGAINTTVGSILPETFKTILAFLPWWVWLGGALYFAGRAGWLTTVAGIIGTKGMALWKTK